MIEHSPDVPQHALRLTDLDPQWTTFAHPAQGVVFLTGVTFACPHCVPLGLPEHGPQRARRLVAMFTNPIDPDGIVERTGWHPYGLTWQRTGETFDDLTLEPSINTTDSGHWHGRITNGAIV